MTKILIPLPDKDFDLTEVAVPWHFFKKEGYTVVFATEKGNIAQTDPLLITGVLFGQLGAKPEAIAFYRELEKSSEFLNPITYDAINVAHYNALHLPGGHAKGMKQYLENALLQEKVSAFFEQNKIVGAICHGGIVLARTMDKNTGKSVIYNKKMTALTKLLERAAYYVSAWKLGNYYRTYPIYVQDEICQNLRHKSQFTSGNPLKPMVVTDDKLITARWPLDAYLYAQTMIAHIKALPPSDAQ
jgi:putative intracellular protease/amidase